MRARFASERLPFLALNMPDFVSRYDRSERSAGGVIFLDETLQNIKEMFACRIQILK